MATDLQDFSRTLFAAADQLWTNSTLRPDQYAQPVLALIALRQMEAKFEAVHAKLAPQYRGRLKPAPADYQAKGAIYLPDNARFSRLLALPGTADLGAELNAAMKGIADTNPDLAGALPQGYAGLPNDVLQELLRLLAPLKIEGDAYGLIFEYFMGQFASSFMQKGGEYFTPASIVKLIVEIIEPYHGTIFDPACGSGGMFVHSAEFVRRHHRSPSNEISIYGVEKMSDTLRLCRMNLAVHGLSGDIREAVQVTARAAHRVVDQELLEPTTDVVQQRACGGAHDERLQRHVTAALPHTELTRRLLDEPHLLTQLTRPHLGKPTRPVPMRRRQFHDGTRDSHDCENPFPAPDRARRAVPSRWTTAGMRWMSSSAVGRKLTAARPQNGWPVGRARPRDQ